MLTHTLEWGGAELHTLELLKVLRDRGHEVSLIELGHNLYSKRLEGGGGIKVVNLQMLQPLHRLGFLACARIVKNLGGSRVAILPKAIFALESWRFDLVARLRFPSYVTIEHSCAGPMPSRSSRRHLGGLLPGFGLWWYELLVSRFLRSVGPNLIICISDAIRADLINYYHFPPHKLKTIHGGVAMEKFKRREESRRKMRAAWGIGEGSLVFGAVGRMVPLKRFDMAIELFGRLVSEDPGRDIRLVLVGDGPLLDTLKGKALDAGLMNRVVFAGHTEAPWEAYSAFDVFLMPSRNESLSLVLMEAMACNCLPIATAVGGVPEIIISPHVGWLVESDDRDGFFSAMKQVVHCSSTQLNEMGSRARKHVASNFNARVQFAAIVDVIEELDSRRTLGATSP